MNPKILTVIIRDPSNFIHLQEPCTFRSVQIKLNAEQQKQIALQQRGINCGKVYYEEISHCFFEPLEELKEGVE